MLGRRVEGQALGIDPDGCLWIRKDDGLQERILAGDVERS
jgi:biotin-(acetyl-CoA carboxylase) ligase